MESRKSYRFGAGRYIQEPGAIKWAGEEISRYGSNAYIIGGPTALKLAESGVRESLSSAGIRSFVETYSGLPSYEKIAELSNTVKTEGRDVIAGIGGGRIMDLAKAAASRADVPVVLIPTSAATCAAFSPLSVIYTPEGRSCGYEQHDYEVNSVLVDEDIMITQPVRLLAAGILDAMAKYIEIETLEPFDLQTSTIERHSAFHMAGYLYEVLSKNGIQAAKDLTDRCLSKELHDVIYSNIALTGIVSAMMRGEGQIALGHAFNNMLRRHYLGYANGYLHGELVAMGLIAQLVYNKHEERIPEIVNMMKEFGLPCTLQEIGIEPTEENRAAITAFLRTYPFYTDDSVHSEALEEAVLRVL